MGADCLEKPFVPPVGRNKVEYVLTDRSNNEVMYTYSMILEGSTEAWVKACLSLTAQHLESRIMVALSEYFTEIRVIPESDGIKILFLEKRTVDGVAFDMLTYDASLFLAPSNNCSIC